MLLNQTKLSISEIQQVWKAVKDLTRNRTVIHRTPLEIARQAGWDETVADVEDARQDSGAGIGERRLSQAQEERAAHLCHEYSCQNMMEAALKIEASMKMSENERLNAKSASLEYADLGKECGKCTKRRCGV